MANPFTTGPFTCCTREDETEYIHICDCPRAWWATTQISPSSDCYVSLQEEVKLWGWAEPCFDSDDGLPSLRWNTRTTTYNGGTVERFHSYCEGNIAIQQDRYTGSMIETYDLDGNYTLVSNSLLHERRTRQVIVVDGECEPQSWSEWTVEGNPVYSAAQCQYVSHTSTSFDIADVYFVENPNIIGTVTYSGAVTEEDAEAHQLYTVDCNTYQSHGDRIRSAYQTRSNFSYEYQKQKYAMVFEGLVKGAEYEYSFNVYYAGSGPFPSVLFEDLQYTHTVTGTFIATADFHVIGGTGVADDNPYASGRVKDVVPQTDMPFVRGEAYEYGELTIELK